MFALPMYSGYYLGLAGTSQSIAQSAEDAVHHHGSRYRVEFDAGDFCIEE